MDKKTDVSLNDEAKQETIKSLVIEACKDEDEPGMIASYLRTVITFHEKYKHQLNRLSYGFLRDLPDFLDAAYQIHDYSSLPFRIRSEIDQLKENYLSTISKREAGIIFDRYSYKRLGCDRFYGVMEIIDGYARANKIEIYPGYLELEFGKYGFDFSNEAVDFENFQADRNEACKFQPLIDVFR